MDKTKRINKPLKIVTYVILLLLFMSIIGGVVYLTNGLKEQPKTFFLVVNGENVMNDTTNYKLEKQAPFVVGVKQVFNLPSEDIKYEVKVVPNKIEKQDFDFYIAEEPYSFQAEKDLTSGFLISLEKDKFTITSKGGINEILSSIYPNQTISDCTPYEYENMYRLVVTSDSNTVILLLIVLLMVLFPIIPYILKGVIWIISLPFKLISRLIKSCKKKE